jgi:hypothetical protein
MTTVKNEIINDFKRQCLSLDEFQIEKREIAVKSQFQRGLFEIDGIYGRIRIIEGSIICHIILFPLLENPFNLKDKISFEIPKEKYEELKKMYFGEFKENDPLVLKYKR